MLIVSNAPAEKAPTAVVNLIGRKQYARCAKDIYYFSQVRACQLSNFTSPNVDFAKRLIDSELSVTANVPQREASHKVSTNVTY